MSPGYQTLRRDARSLASGNLEHRWLGAEALGRLHQTKLPPKCDQLVRLVEKENDDLDDKPEASKKQIRKVPSEVGVKRSGSTADLKPPAKKGRPEPKA
eukprot:1176725-Prorocentrum_minimum.AAC.2